MNADDLSTSITNTRATLNALSAAILALADPTIEVYRLDTGQTVTSVTRTDLPRLIKSQDSLMNTLSTLCIRQTGSGAVMARTISPQGGRGNW
jgi:hypothetical protein